MMKAYLYGANLSRSNLIGSNLSDAYLEKANLEEADLSGANLTNANLEKANLTEAIFNDAIVEYAKFGHNQGVSESLKRDLIQRGAIFVDDFGAGDRSKEFRIQNSEFRITQA